MKVDTKAVAVVKATTTKVANAATELVVKNQEGYVKATDLLGQVKAAQKAVKEKKEAITKPMNEALKSVRALFAPIEDAATEAERTIKGKMLDYVNAEEVKARAKEEKIAEKVESGEMSFEKGAEKIAKIAQPETTVEGDKGKSNVRTKLVVSITDPKKVPVQYWKDERVQNALRDALRRAVESDAMAAYRAGKTIEGVRVEEVKIIAGSNLQSHWY